MKKTNLIKSLSVLAIVLMLNACKKDNSAAPASGTAVNFSVKADNASNTLNSVNGGTQVTNSTASASVNWTSAVANIALLKLEARTKNTEIEIKTRALSNIDLFAVTPATISTAIDTGTYREIEIKVELMKTSSSAIPLTLKGSFTTPGGAVVPVEFDFNDNAEIKAEAQNVTVDGKTDIATTVKIHLNMLLAGVSAATLDAATRTGGTIVISSSSNANIYNQIVANFPSSGEGEGFEHKGKDGRGHDGGNDH